MKIHLKLLLKSVKSVAQNRENNTRFHLGTRGYIYKKTEDLDLHDKITHKYFTFSNLFVVKDEKIEENKAYTLYISSPDSRFISMILYNTYLNEIVNLGEYSFVLEKIIYEKGFSIKDFSIFQTATMINLTKNLSKSYKALIYGKDVDFIKHLNNNLLSKYNEYNKTKINIDLFKNCKIRAIGKKSVCLKINKETGDFNIIGNILEFKFGKLNKTQRDVLEFGLQCGFGERTSYGLGFLFPVKRSDPDIISEFNDLMGA
ncbi:MAG: CRISPR-associated endoribonuclease Cas6 [Candidatus Woesearchaeota archaeon]